MLSSIKPCKITQTTAALLCEAQPRSPVPRSAKRPTRDPRCRSYDGEIHYRHKGDGRWVKCVLDFTRDDAFRGWSVAVHRLSAAVSRAPAAASSWSRRLRKL